MLELKNICYTVSTPETGEQTILKDISVTIPDGKLIVFTGPNGGGKTTLAKVIMGLVTPTSGQILWNGEDITALDITARAKRGISYGFQQPPRFKGITVRDLLTIASGDSHNDLGMIQASKAGFLFKSTDAIKSEYPEIPAYETYDELYDAIRKVIEG